MHTVTYERELAVPAQRIFEYIVNFGDIEAWWPKGGALRIQKVVNEGDGIGMVRHIYNEGMPTPISERLDFLDTEAMKWKLSIVGVRPAGITQYQATGQLEETGAGTCKMAYLGEFEAEEGRVEEARNFLKGAYVFMFDGLEAAAQGGQS